jgi:hypothetical protein
LRTRKAGYVEAILVIVLAISACSHHSTSPGFTDYNSFVNSYNKQIETPMAEIYGKYAAQQSDRKVRANFNLLLDPGKRAYMEILDPSDRLVHALSLSPTKICLLWAKDNSYLEEEATPENLKAIIGLPVNPDDALQLIAGQGLQFSEWQQAEEIKDGWKLVRGSFSAKIVARENLSKIETLTNQGSFLTRYDQYQFLDNQSRPTRIRFDVPDRKMSLEIKIDKYEPRNEQPTPDLFDLKVPANGQRVRLNDIYHGKPLLLD